MARPKGIPAPGGKAKKPKPTMLKARKFFKKKKKK